MKTYDSIIIGGGAAGMMAASGAAGKTLLLEKNPFLGKKLNITGKGRCNITNAVPVDEILQNIPGSPSFLYSALYTLDSFGLMSVLEETGLELKTERGNRVFPVSDKAADVTAALKKRIGRNVEIRYDTEVSKILTADNRVTGVLLSDGEMISSEKILIATGGMSYPKTGSTGDGYRFAEALGHTVIKPVPSLCPLISSDKWIADLQGLSLKNIAVKILDGKRTLYRDFGEMLFTDCGVSGPVILSASRFAAVNPDKPLTLSIDLKPALDEAALDARILRDFAAYRNKDFINSLDELLPKRMIPVIVSLSGIEPRKKVNEITRDERKVLAGLLKALRVNISGTGGFDEAVITAGGVKTTEIDPSTMESKIIKGLYFAGEVIDVDGFTGGFNLQIAFSTGYLAGLQL